MIHRLALASLALGMAFYAVGRLEQDSQNQFVPIYIQKIRNLTSASCSLEGLPVAPDKTTRVSKLLIPFISIASYLREYADKKAYTPEAALKITTPHGQYRLWASEAGVMYAPDAHDAVNSFDSTWEAEKILGTTARELGTKREYLATLVLKAYAHKKTTLALEPAHA